MTSIQKNYFQKEIKPYGTMTERYNLPSDEYIKAYDKASSAMVTYDLKNYNGKGNQDGFISKEEYLNPEFKDADKYLTDFQKNGMPQFGIEPAKRKGTPEEKKELEYKFKLIDANEDNKLSMPELVASERLKNLLTEAYRKMPPNSNSEQTIKTTVEGGHKAMLALIKREGLDNPEHFPQKPAETKPYSPLVYPKIQD